MAFKSATKNFESCPLQSAKKASHCEAFLLLKIFIAALSVEVAGLPAAALVTVRSNPPGPLHYLVELFLLHFYITNFKYMFNSLARQSAFLLKEILICQGIVDFHSAKN
jgi:hypothetical protein